MRCNTSTVRAPLDNRSSAEQKSVPLPHLHISLHKGRTGEGSVEKVLVSQGDGELLDRRRRSSRRAPGTDGVNRGGSRVVVDV